MKDFYENVVLQLLFNKSENLINLWKYSLVFLTNNIWDPPTTNKLKNKRLRNWKLRGYPFMTPN